MTKRQQGLADMPADLKKQANAIAVALQQGKLAQAEQQAIATLARAPKHPEILRLFGTVQYAQGKAESAIDTLLEAEQQSPGNPIILNTLGAAYERIQDNARARDALRRACESGPEIAGCWFNYGRRLFMDGNIEEAIPALKKAVSLEPRHASARTMLANVLRADGKVSEAEEQFRRIISDHPNGAGLAWWGLALLKPMPLTDQDVDTLRGIVSARPTVSIDRIASGFALAFALEQRGDFAGAFAQMKSAHELAGSKERYNAQAFSQHVDRILEAFSTPPSGCRESQGEEVIFVVSLPRSGSTLTEQILASHSLIEGGTEIPDLAQVIMDESDRVRQAFPNWVRTHSEKQWQALGQEYLKRTSQWRTQRPRFTDKAPRNWQYIGAILAMLPNAKIVVCRRDPLETCLGCFRYLYAQYPYTHRFEDLAAHWRDFDRMVNRWKELYPDRVREQVYENLQSDPEGQIRELLEFCDLPFEETCLNFHQTKRRVTTPSAAQVREPIRRDTARAHKYGALLDPLRTALGMPPFASP